MSDSPGDARPTFYEFFAGGGMARAGFGDGWRCLFANDIDPAKAAAYTANWGDDDFRLGDIAALTAADLPGTADLIWGSFPCQDLSLAGGGAGLSGARSGTFHVFWNLIQDLKRAGRAPHLVVVENVCGSLTSRGGRDFKIICRTFVDGGYRPGVLIVNANLFTPQSRPRLFVVGVRADVATSVALERARPDPLFHPPALRRAVAGLPAALARSLVWWALPGPETQPPSLVSIMEAGVPDWPADQTARLLAMMSPANSRKVEAVRSAGGGVGAVFRRTRVEAGRKVQRAEVRFDRAGCLRTPAGGSSRQILIRVEPDAVHARLFTPREMARLMGLPDNYHTPLRATAAAHLLGDGVAAPVVRALAEHLLEPLLNDAQQPRTPSRFTLV